MSTSLLTLFIFIFFITSLASWLYILNEVDPLSKKIKLFLTTLITTCLILTFSSAYTFKKYISERLDTFEVFEKYYPPKGCMNKINVVIGKNGNELWKKAHGIDNTPVEPYTERKSISTEINNFIEENDIFSFYKQTFDDTNTIGIIKVLNNLKVDEIFETFVNNIDKITQWDRAKFYALYLGYICDLDENEFGRWKRVSFNLINNQLIQSPDDLIKTIQSLNNLIEQSNKDIYGYIKDNYEVIHYFSTIQRKEESLKVNLISNDENWEKELIEAEQHFYLDGQIKFLIDFSNKELETFKIYRTKFLNLWKLTKYKSNIIQRALLAEYDYTCLNSREYIGKYSLCSFGTGLREKNENWRKVFKENDFKLFLDNLNLYDLENSLIKIINKYKFDCKDWKSFIINPKYEWDIINKIRNGHFQIKNENNIFLNDGDTLSTSWSWSRVAELKSYYTFMYLINNSFQENIKKILNQDITLNYYSSSETEDICFYFIIKHNDNNLGIDIKFDTLKNKYLFRTYCIKPYQDLEEIELNFDLYSVKKINDFIQLEEEIISKINNFNKNNLYKI